VTLHAPVLPFFDTPTREISAESLTARVADYFKARPNVWIDAHELLKRPAATVTPIRKVAER
jgi:hypothetical protein